MQDCYCWQLHLFLLPARNRAYHQKRQLLSPANAEQPFQAAVHNASLVNEKTAYTQGGGAEVGYRVHFSVGGTIIQLGANMATTGTYVVSFWRTSDTMLMARASVTVTDTAKFAYTNITSINVLPDTSYTVSIHIANGRYTGALDIYLDTYP